MTTATPPHPSSRAERWAAVAQSALLLEDLVRLGEVFSHPSVLPAVVVKGGALAFTLYPDPAMRPVSDIDLLVRKEDLPEALARLRAAGYQEQGQEMAPGLARILAHHFHLARETGRSFHLEVHWTLALSDHHRQAPDMDWFWAHTEPLRLPFPSPFLTLDPTAHLLYVAAHAMLYHGEAEADPKWVYDVHLLVEREGARIRWEELAEQAAAWRWTEAVLRALQRAAERFGTAIPPEALAALGAHRDETIADLLERKAVPRRKGETTWEKLSALDWTGRMALLRGLLFPSPAFVRWRYRPKPSWTWPLCYPYRWWDIFGEAVRLAGKALRHRLPLLR